MQKTLLKKSMNLFLCGILSTAVLLGGCGIGNTANTQKEEQPAAAVQQEVNAGISLAQSTSCFGIPRSQCLWNHEQGTGVSLIGIFTCSGCQIHSGFYFTIQCNSISIHACAESCSIGWSIPCALRT